MRMRWGGVKNGYESDIQERRNEKKKKRNGRQDGEFMERKGNELNQRLRTDFFNKFSKPI
jgi:hypothetical protein